MTMRHYTVYKDDEYYAGWPFNGGMWQFADGEIAVGFVRAPCAYDSTQSIRHGNVDCANGEHVIMRTRDSGKTWGDMTTVYQRPEFDEKLYDSETVLEPADPTEDGFCLLAGFGIPRRGHGDTAFIMRSMDRGRTWSEPIRAPLGRFKFVSVRPCYLIMPDKSILLFGIGGETPNTEQNSIPTVLKSADGGATWNVIGEISPEPRTPMAIMAYPLLLGNGDILAAVRRQGGGFGNAFTQIYVSEDGGYNWSYRSQVNQHGAPANLIQLPDQRIVCVYGYRQPSYGLRAKISSDEGKTWQCDIILRKDGGNADLGYPRTVLLPDGKMLIVYYHNSLSIRNLGGVRHIAATVWEAPRLR